MKFSKKISIILHPVFMPILIFHLSVTFVPVIRFSSLNNIFLAYLILFMFTIALPLIAVVLFKKKGKLVSLEMNKRKERVLPLFISSLSFLIGFFFLEKLVIFSPILKAEFLGSLLLVFFSSLISKFWKISLHMLGIGGLLGALIALEFLYHNLVFLIIFCILLSGILAYSRLQEKAHTPTQVYVGFLIGFFIEHLVIVFY